MSVFASGSNTYFMSSTAPTGWTQVTTYNNTALRVVSGSSGGTVTNSTGFTSIHSPSLPFTGSVSASGGSTDGTSLTDSNIAPHTHLYFYSWGYVKASVGVYPNPTQPVNHGIPYPALGSSPSTVTTASTGAGATHSHGINASFNLSSSINFSLNYIDMILCTKN
jgi:hypothetical protein